MKLNFMQNKLKLNEVGHIRYLQINAYIFQSSANCLSYTLGPQWVHWSRRKRLPNWWQLMPRMQTCRGLPANLTGRLLKKVFNVTCYHTTDWGGRSQRELTRWRAKHAQTAFRFILLDFSPKHLTICRIMAVDNAYTRRKIAVLGSRSVGLYLDTSSASYFSARGPSVPGKSALILQFFNTYFTKNYFPTIDSDIFQGTIVYDGIDFDCEIIDTAGQVSRLRSAAL